jgi:hypothetical protein
MRGGLGLFVQRWRYEQRGAGPVCLVLRRGRLYAENLGGGGKKSEAPQANNFV